MNTNEPEDFWEGKPQARPVRKVSVKGDRIRNGLAQLILTVVQLLRELLEKQAIRRIEAGSLDDEEVERLGVTFKALKDEMVRLQDYFEFDDEDLNVNLGPLLVREDIKSGKTSAVELLDRLLGQGIVVKGDIVLSVADVDLLSLNIGAVLASIDKARELYSGPATSEMMIEMEKLRKENERLKLQQGNN
jgi:hypothetical protein